MTLGMSGTSLTPSWSLAPPPPLCATSNQMPVPDGSDITGEQLTMLFAGPAEHEAAVADVISGVGFVPK